MTDHVLTSLISIASTIVIWITGDKFLRLLGFFRDVKQDKQRYLDSQVRLLLNDRRRLLAQQQSRIADLEETMEPIREAFAKSEVEIVRLKFTVAQRDATISKLEQQVLSLQQKQQGEES